MERYRREARRPNPTWLEALNVAKDLGYRKVLPCLLLGMLAVAAPASKPRGVPIPFVETFDSVGGLIDRGWTLRNNSQPGNALFPTWFLGSQSAWFAQPRFAPAFGPQTSYLAANYRVCGGASNVAGSISLWAITPAIRFSASNDIRFSTRSAGGAPDCLQVLFAFGEQADPGFTADSIGDFTNVLEIVTGNGMPTEWTEFVVTLNLATPGLGRVAFRYVVPDGGPAGTRGDYIGIDSLSIAAALPGPVPMIRP